MVELSYNSKLKSPGRLSAPLAAKFVAELLFGAAWSDNPRVKKKPVYRSRDGAYRRCHLFLRNGKYTMKTKVVSIPEGRQQEFAEAYRLFKEGEGSDRSRGPRRKTKRGNRAGSRPCLGSRQDQIRVTPSAAQHDFHDRICAGAPRIV